MGTLTLDTIESEETSPAESSISIPWCCRSALHRPTILCSALDRRFIHNRLPGEPARRRSRARSPLRTCESERQDDNEPAAIPSFYAVFSLVGGRDSTDHARHWCYDGRVARPLPPANIDPSRGPIWLRGGISLTSADGYQYEVRNRMTVCRCGASRNKPFCDGSHASIKYKAKTE